MATSDSGRAAHELGGGSWGAAEPRRPAMTVTTVVSPSASTASTRGMSSSQNIVK